MKKSKTQIIFLIAAFILQWVVIVLICGAYSEIAGHALWNKSFPWAVIYHLELCVTAMLPPVVTMLLLVLQMARPTLTHRKIMTALSCLLHCVTVGFLMFVWEYDRNCPLTIPCCGACAVAILSCALLLYTLKWNPWVYLVPGGILAAWGLLEAIMGESVFFDPSFSLLFLEAGLLLPLIGWIQHMQTKASARAAAPVKKPEAETPKTPKALTCSHCGAKLQDGDIYCVECGEKP